MPKEKYDFNQRSEHRLVRVTDDWYPCFEGGYVLLHISQHFFKEHYVKITAWGADDTGVEMEFTSHSKDAVDSIYDHWKEYIFDRVPDGVDREWFYEHGFYDA